MAEARRRPPKRNSLSIMVPVVAVARARPRLLFARNFFANPRRVGSVIPSSRRLIQRLLSQTDWQTVKVAVEYGPGTGGVTRAILAKLGPDARLFAFEINNDFVDFLRREIPDPRLTLIAGSAETVAAVLTAAGVAHCDVAVSSLPFSIMPLAVRQAIVRATAGMLAPGARLIGYQYSTAWLRELRHEFRHVAVQIEPRNWPPAFVFTAHCD